MHARDESDFRHFLWLELQLVFQVPVHIIGGEHTQARAQTVACNDDAVYVLAALADDAEKRVADALCMMASLGHHTQQNEQQSMIDTACGVNHTPLGGTLGTVGA